MELSLQYNLYYTHFSFLLFFISFCFPFTSKVKYFILLNSIIVGIAGNIIIARDYANWMEWYAINKPEISQNDINIQLLIGNFIEHTLPAIISLLLLPFCTSYLNSISDVFYWTFIILISVLSWSLLSYKGSDFQNKIVQAYPHTQFLLNSVLISCFSVFGLICYFNTH
jgi:hypothetical protein